MSIQFYNLKIDPLDRPIERPIDRPAEIPKVIDYGHKTTDDKPDLIEKTLGE